MTSAWSTMPAVYDVRERAQSTPTHAAEAEPDREGDEERQRVHATSLNQTTDIPRRHGGSVWTPDRHNRLSMTTNSRLRRLRRPLGLAVRVGGRRPARLRLLRAGDPRARGRAAAPVSVLWVWWGFAGARR